MARLLRVLSEHPLIAFTGHIFLVMGVVWGLFARFSPELKQLKSENLHLKEKLNLYTDIENPNGTSFIADIDELNKGQMYSNFGTYDESEKYPYMVPRIFIGKDEIGEGNSAVTVWKFQGPEAYLAGNESEDIHLFPRQLLVKNLILYDFDGLAKNLMRHRKNF